MKLNYLAFIKKLFIYTIFIAVIGAAAAYLLPENYITPTLPFLYVFFFAATLLVHYVLLQVSLKKASSFINYFMLLTFGKLIFFLSIVLAYALLRREDAAQFIIAFFALYIFFTVFEVIQSLSLTKTMQQLRKEQQANEEAKA
jgi:hypothetical protein